MKTKSASRIDPVGLVILVLLLSAGPARATVRFWTGSSASWNTDSAWNPSGVPVTGDDLVFPVGVTTNLTSTMDLPATPVFDQISINSSGYVTNPSGAVGRSFGVTTLIQDISPNGGNVINAPVVLSGNVNIKANVGPLVFGGALSGSGGVTLTGAGIVRFAPVGNSYGGLTQINQGTLELSRAPSLMPGVTIPGDLFIGDGIGAASSDIVKLLGNNMIADNSLVLVTTTGLLDLNNFGEVLHSLIGQGNVDLGSGTLTMAPPGSFETAFHGVISGTGSLVKTGQGLFQLFGQASNTYTGSTIVLDGILGLGHTGGSVAIPGNVQLGTSSPGTVGELRLDTQSDNIANAADVTVLTSGLFNLNGFAETIGTLNGSGNVNLGSGTLTIEPVGAGTSGVFSGIISGTGSTAKRGTGRQSLDGANSYTGPTVIAAGTLLINGFQPDSEVQLTGGSVGGTGHTGPIRAVSGSSRIRPGLISTGSAAKLRTGNLSLGAAGTTSAFELTLNGPNAGTDHDQLDVIGTVDLGTTSSLNVVSLSSAFFPGMVLKIIENDFADPVTGQFSGLPEGSAFRPFGFSEFNVSYVGGSGNDVTLTFRGRAGDVNGDGGIDTVDIFALLQFLFGNGPTPAGVADIDGNGVINVLDLFRLINGIF